MGNLEKQIMDLTNELEYVKNLNRKQISSLKSSIITKINKDIELELLGLEDICTIVDDTTKLKIQRRIDRIRKILTK